MAEPFKNMFREETIRSLGAALAQAGPLDLESFVAASLDGLEELELKDRVRHVAAAVRAHLHPDWPQALAHILRALPPPLTSTDAVTGGFSVWPLCHAVEEYGLDHPELSIPALREITRRFSAEFAIRPYLERWPEQTLAALGRWVADEDVHVRRLVSEGTRPRLPWGSRLRRFQDDPAPILDLLEQLKDDPEEYVRRSVANHLGDLAKDDPDLVVRIATRWLEDASPERRRLVEHALRYPVKKGHTGALATLGFGPPRLDEVGFTGEPATVDFPGELRLSLTLRSAAAQELVVDYVVQFRTARGTLSPRTFKWTTRSLTAGQELTLTKRHRFKPISTRRFHSGAHRVDLLVNGEVLGTVPFELEVS